MSSHCHSYKYCNKLFPPSFQCPSGCPQALKCLSVLWTTNCRSSAPKCRQGKQKKSLPLPNPRHINKGGGVSASTGTQAFLVPIASSACARWTTGRVLLLHVLLLLQVGQQEGSLAQQQEGSLALAGWTTGRVNKLSSSRLCHRAGLGLPTCMKEVEASEGPRDIESRCLDCCASYAGWHWSRSEQTGTCSI